MAKKPKFQKAFENGEISQEEFERRAMQSLCKRLDNQLDNDPELRAELEGKVKPY